MIGARPLAFADTECYPNYWLLKFRAQAGAEISFRLLAGQSFDRTVIAAILSLFDTFCVVTFNGNHYDIPMITGAICGFDAEKLKALNDRIIVEGLKPWELGLLDWKPSDHIDIFEVAPGTTSQKQYAGRIHYKTIRDLPFDPGTMLTLPQRIIVDDYCKIDIGALEALFDALRPQIEQRVALSERYGVDLRSKSDAQLAEAVLKLRCEQGLGRRIFKPEIDWNLRFNYRIPAFIDYALPQLQAALGIVRNAIFRLAANLTVAMPPELEELEIVIGQSIYKLGIGGLHSQEKRVVHKSDSQFVILDNDVASYYPSLILNSGEFPIALGPMFLREYAAIKDERLAAKTLQAKLKKAGDTTSPEYERARTDNEGGKIMINGTFGKTGSPYSVLFAPSMLIQTTITGQLSLLMLIEWHEYYGIRVISANTDGLVIKCPRDQIGTSRYLIEEWQRRTGLEMETVEYAALYSRDVNNYIAIKPNGDVKRKGEYGPTEPGPVAYLIEKRNPGYEICADAVAAYLAHGKAIEWTIYECRDIRKFVVVQRVAGGAVKLWGEGPRKGELVRDFEPKLIAKGWVKSGRNWSHAEQFQQYSARDAWALSFPPQIPEYLGKVARWYYSSAAPGPIVYHTNGNLVSMTYGAKPCMILPDEFPVDIDYDWYVTKARSMLEDLGLTNVNVSGNI